MNPLDMGVPQDILAFLAKPQVIQKNALSASDNSTTFPSISCPEELLAITLINEKIRGFYGFRGTSIFTLQVNATPFQQGRYILYFCPVAGANNNQVSTANWHTNHAYSLIQITQMPHVELDLACDTQATLRIPWRSVEYNYSIAGLSDAEAWGSTGFARLVPYQKLAHGTGSTTANYTLWHHWEDVELSAPTIPQSGNWKPKKITPTSQETLSNNDGPVSSAFSHASMAATALSRVPLLSPFAGTAAWALDAASGVASVFGWSKPIGPNKNTPIINNYSVGMNNVDGIDCAFNWGASSINEIAPSSEVFGTDYDEMSFDYLKAIPAYYDGFNWDTGASATQLIKTLPIKLDLFKNTTTDGSVANIYSFVPCAYIANFFDYWRGSLVFKIKIVKTGFHSGRMSITYVPHDDRYTAPTMTFATTPYSHRLIVDIREGNEVTIVVPWVSHASWRDRFALLGNLYFHVVDPLVAPDTCSNTIGFLIEVCGGPDMEYALPRKNLFVPYQASAPQAGEWKPDTCAMIEDVIGGASVTTTTMHSELCVGEVVKSFRALGKIYNRIVNDSAPTYATNRVLCPFLYNTMYNNGTSTPQGSVATDYDVYAHLCCSYAMGRGSVRLKIAQQDGDSQNTAWYVWPITPAGSVLNKDVEDTNVVGFTRQAAPELRYDTRFAGTWDMQFPQYMGFHSRANCELNVVPQNRIDQTHGPIKRYVLAQSTVNASIARITIFRALGDDASFGVFCSFPPVWLVPDA